MGRDLEHPWGGDQGHPKTGVQGTLEEVDRRNPREKDLGTLVGGTWGTLGWVPGKPKVCKGGVRVHPRGGLEHLRASGTGEPLGVATRGTLRGSGRRVPQGRVAQMACSLKKID